jgi:hypothetical protein
MAQCRTRPPTRSFAAHWVLLAERFLDGSRTAMTA